MNYLIDLNNSPEFSSKTTEEKLITLLESFCQQAKLVGIEIKPYTPETFKRFQALDLPRQEKILSQFQAYYDIYSSAITNDVDIMDNKSIIWWALRRLGLRPSSDLFTHIQGDDVVEVYSPELVQVFRTFNFFKYCQYSLDQILTYEWPELYSRDEQEAQKMFQLCLEVLQGKRTEISYSGFPEHIVEQKLIPAPNKIKMAHRFAAPVYDGNNVPYLISTFTAERLDS